MELENLKQVYLEEYGLTVFQDGSVFSKNGNELAHVKDKLGYFYISFTMPSGKRKRLSAHRLLALAFIPNPEGKTDVNHIDGNKSNNKLENLEWMTRKENIQHALRNNLFHKRNAKFARNEQIKEMYEAGTSTKALAEMFDLTAIRIWQIVQGHNGTRRTQIAS